MTIKSFEIYFTAEGSFEAQVLPSSLGEATSYVTSPFTTSKVDLGTMSSNDGVFSYKYDEVTDVVAYTHLYQEDAVSGGKPADVATNKNIHPVLVDGNGGYAFGNDTYYMEPPTTLTTPSGWDKNPIGFRVVGATFNYKWGTATTGGTQQLAAGVRITGSNNYNLNAELQFTRSSFTWQVDEYGNLYTGSGEYKKYLACYGDGNERSLSLSSVATGDLARWNLRVGTYNGNLRVYYLSDGGNYYLLNYRTVTEGGSEHVRGFCTLNQTSSLASYSETGSQTITLPSYTPGAYTLTIYDKDGTTVKETIKVNSASDADTYELTGLNNDAVKFQVSGLEGDAQALIDVTLKLQALNPYINSMNIVCEDTPKELQMTQTFTASDFAVSGGEFVFYVPSKYDGQTLNLSFKDLYSNYGDNTYYGETASLTNSRYSFVTSEYFTGHKNIYENTTEVANSDYENKVVTATAGNIRFKFNNAEDIEEGTATVLQEYQFDYDTYQTTTDPDGSGNTGDYINCSVVAGNGTQEAGTFYLFTADETRYNIAPTTAMQHRFYAFYRMDIKVVAKDYTPVATWTKLYDKTFYGEGNTNMKSDSQWGVKLETTDNGEKVTGYLSYAVAKVLSISLWISLACAFKSIISLMRILLRS